MTRLTVVAAAVGMLLSGCALTGAAAIYQMVEGVPSHGRRYYRCHGRDRFTRGPRCRAPWLSAMVAETAVWDAVAAALQRPEALRAAMARYEASRGARDVELRSRVEHLRRQLLAVEHKERRLLDLYLDEAVPMPRIRERLQTLAQERSRLSEAVQRAEAQAAAHGILEGRPEAIKRWSAQARRGLTRLDAIGRRKLLEALVDEIRVGRDRTLEIYGILPSAADTELRRPA